jgi:hypothetical protein
MVLALIPTDGKDNSREIHKELMNLLCMAKQLKLPIVAFAADGAAPELSAQNMMDEEKSELEPITYEYPRFGIALRAPVFEGTGPLVSVTDPPHSRKTCRNQPLYGTHTASIGTGYIVSRSLVNLYKTTNSGLVLRDVEDVDKQDDGAARRLFHIKALAAMTTESDGVCSLREGFLGLFVYLFVFGACFASFNMKSLSNRRSTGTLFDAWLNRSLSVSDRVLAAFRARFWLHLWSLHINGLSQQFPDLYSMKRSFISPAAFHIFNRLCDSLILLTIAYGQYYPNQPFCPWLLGTEFVEHFFGLARMILPNFTYAELLKMVQNVMVRQRILLTGNFKENRERNSASGYILDYDPSPLSSKEHDLALVNLTRVNLNGLVELAFKEASSICKDLLGIPVPTIGPNAPLKLVKVGAPRRKAGHVAEVADADIPSEGEDELSETNQLSSEEEGLEGAEAPRRMNLGELTASAAHGTARYSALCEDFEELEAPKFYGPPPPPLPPPPPPPSVKTIPECRSDLLDENGTVTIACMLSARRKLQSQTFTHSERTVHLKKKVCDIVRYSSSRVIARSQTPPVYRHSHCHQNLCGEI